jgi:hypothetical protein
MRTKRFVLAGCLFVGLIGLVSVENVSAQEPYPSPMMGAYARRPPVYPYVHSSRHAYHKAVRFGLAPVAPPAITRGPVDYFGRGLYGPPYYAYPRPPLGYTGYAGFSGTDPHAYHSVIPPAIPPAMPYPPRDSLAPSSQPTTAPSPPVEAIPTPPSEPGQQP